MFITFNCWIQFALETFKFDNYQDLVWVKNLSRIPVQGWHIEGLQNRVFHRSLRIYVRKPKFGASWGLSVQNVRWGTLSSWSKCTFTSFISTNLFSWYGCNICLRFYCKAWWDAHESHTYRFDLLKPVSYFLFTIDWSKWCLFCRFLNFIDSYKNGKERQMRSIELWYDHQYSDRYVIKINFKMESEFTDYFLLSK